MKYLLFFGCLVYFGALCGQAPMDTLASEACQEGRQEALAILAEGRLCYGFGGHDSEKLQTMIHIYKKYYGIEAYPLGCLWNEKNECFNETMKKAIEQRFGTQFFDEAHAKADSLNRLGLVNRQAQFGEDVYDLPRYVYCHLDESFFRSDSVRGNLLVVQFTVGADGALADWTLRLTKRFSGDTLRVEQALEKVFADMPKWTPAIKQEQAVSSRWNLPIRFTREQRRKLCSE